MAMPFTTHTVVRSASLSPEAVPARIDCPEPGDSASGTKPRIALCTGCYEGRSDYMLYLPRRKCPRCEDCAQAHLKSACFCGDDAIAPRLEGKAMWFACEKHQYFTFHPGKWKPLPLTREEKRGMRRERLQRRMLKLRRGVLATAFLASVYFIILRTPLRERYDFDILDVADNAFVAASQLLTGVLKIGMEIAHAL